MTTTATREPLEGLRRHKLLTKEIAAKLPTLEETANDGLEAAGDRMVYLKLFSPAGRYTLYVTARTDDTLFGYILSPLGADCDELGYSSLEEVATVTVFGSMPAIERDCYWDPIPLRECEGVSL